MTTEPMVVMLASENDALKGGKVGGVGDVVRDLPRALASMGWRTVVITPSYGFLHADNPSALLTRVRFPFGGTMHEGELWEVRARVPDDRITHLVFEHPDVRGEPIYCNDPPGQPFARDATKYALFCSAVGQYLLTLQSPYVLHLHDWHTGTMLLLREVHPRFRALKDIRTVFTIHNLAIQGTRPMLGKQASVATWFPELFTRTGWVSAWADPRYSEQLFTPMAAGIQFADRVNTVSPTYATEILEPSDHRNGFYGGEGLQSLLRQATNENRLFGILNGAEYSNSQPPRNLSYGSLCNLISAEVQGLLQRKEDPHLRDVLKRVEILQGKSPKIILTSVTRVVEQKIRLLFEVGSTRTPALEEILTHLDDRDGVYFFLGSGTSDYEQLLLTSFRKHDHFLYIRAYSDPIAQALYATGTLFLMPSSFEPCGISQMLAMREGQPCIVNAVGGLKDTIKDGVSGFRFAGRTLREQVDNLVETTQRAMNLALDGHTQWDSIRREAAQARFTWEKSARQYIDLLYG